MPLLIENVTDLPRDDDKPHDYIIRVNRRPLARFQVVRSLGYAACLRAAADALECTSADEAPADDGPVFHMNLLSHEDNEAWLDSARRVAAKHEAPASKNDYAAPKTITEAPADQIERWAKALYDNNAFYAPDPDDAGWSDMAPNDGGIHDLHMDMARAAKFVWDRADEAPAEGAGGVHFVGPLECLQEIAEARWSGDNALERIQDFAARELAAALSARSSAPEAREGEVS